MNLKDAKKFAYERAKNLQPGTCQVIRRIAKRKFVVEDGVGQSGDGTVMVVHTTWVHNGWYYLGREGKAEG